MTNDASKSIVAQGEILAGKYIVDRVLGAGAMGVIVAARHRDLGELRALKFMLPHMLGDADGVERFLREAKAACRLKSQHVVKIFDVGRLDNGAPFIVMEYLEGFDLKKLLEGKKLLPIPEAINYMLQTCEAVREAHSLGIIHRDLKPANLFLAKGLNETRIIKVLDFGIAKISAQPGSTEQDMTSTNMVMGSPLYMSPEQMRSTKNADDRSDIWSLGVILYRMLTGRLPFKADTTPELMALVLCPDPPPPPSLFRQDLPRELELVVLKCLEKDISNRFQSVQDFVEALICAMEPRSAGGRSELTNLEATEALKTHVWRSSIPSPRNPSSGPPASQPEPSSKQWSAPISHSLPFIPPPRTFTENPQPAGIDTGADTKPSAFLAGHPTPGAPHMDGSWPQYASTLPSAEVPSRRSLLVGGIIAGVLLAVGVVLIMMLTRTPSPAVANQQELATTTTGSNTGLNAEVSAAAISTLTATAENPSNPPPTGGPPIAPTPTQTTPRSTKITAPAKTVINPPGSSPVTNTAKTSPTPTKTVNTSTGFGDSRR